MFLVKKEFFFFTLECDAGCRLTREKGELVVFV